MTNSKGQLDNGKLLSKLQTVILRLDKNKTFRPPNVEAATDYLQQVSYTYMYMKVQAHLPQPIPNLGEIIPVSAQAHLYKHAKSRATEVPSLEN